MEKIIEENKQGNSLVLEHKPENTKKLFIESYGCAMNFSDSEVVAAILTNEGYNTTTILEEADLVLVNTCSIRDMAKNLVIVESPAKAKTIEKFLGSEYQVESSYGHIADLPSKEIGVDVLNGFKPKYEVSSDKKALVTKLKTLAKNADMVWLASDEDREGEAISWHLAEELKLDKAKTKRIVFHEITKLS